MLKISFPFSLSVPLIAFSALGDAPLQEIIMATLLNAF